ncbi:CotH kinase family protein [Nanoarchaeota archaeon]
MEIKGKKVDFHPLKKLKSLGRFVFNKKVKIILKILIVLTIFFIGTFSGLIITGFFGTLDNPSQRAIEVIHFFGIYDLKSLKISLAGAAKENIKIPINYIIGRFSNPKKIYIDINFENFKKIEYKREQAIERGMLLSSGADYVPATIRYEDKQIPVRLRLKGDGNDHWDGNKWSFRIKVTGDNAFLGMKTFSIQDPRTRSYLSEFIYHQALKREGIIGLRYEFIDVTVNGDHKGIYALEEHFEKQLIESNGQREGILLKFNEDFAVREIERITNNVEPITEAWSYVMEPRNYFGWFYGNNIETFDDEDIFMDPELSKQFQEAKNLLELFKQEKLKASQVFDVDKFATYFAINTLMEAQHASSWSNIRFYYNPVTSRLEPVGFDASGGGSNAYQAMDAYLLSCPLNLECSNKTKTFYELIFSDEKIFNKYIQELQRVSEQSYLDDLFYDLDEGIKNNLQIIHKDDPFYHFPKENFYNNQNQIKHRLNPSKSMNVYFKDISPSKKITLQIANIDYFPLEIINVIYNDSIIFRSDSSNKVLSPRTSQEKIVYKEFKFNLPPNFKWDNNMTLNLKVNYKIIGLEKLANETVSYWPVFEEDFLETSFILEEDFLEIYDFLEINKLSKIISVKKGNWVLNKSLIFPEDFSVQFKAGTSIDLIEDAMILSYSPLRFFGTKEEPIKIISSDGKGQGIVILNAGKESSLNNVYFENLTNPSKGNWGLTGAITFYESPIKLNNVKIIGASSEDSLNIIRSEFEIINSNFEDCGFDCLDVDFGNGLIENTLFYDCGNDCVDFSGSEVKLDNIKIINAGDKGISVGEESKINIGKIKVDQGYVCIASKDRSEMHIEEIEISNCSYGFAVYQKKPEFGSASIYAKKVDSSLNEEEYILEKGSEFSLDGKIILGTEEKVYEILYPLEK